MKKAKSTMTISGFLFLSSTVFASTNSASTFTNEAEQTPYETLDGLYSKSEAALFSDIKGYWTGRCFETWEKSTPLPNLLLGLELQSLSGPLLDNELLFNLYSAHKNDGADYYDKLSDYFGDPESEKGAEIRENHAAEIKNLLRRKELKLLISDDLLATETDFQPNAQMDTRTTFRLYKNYILAKVENLISGNQILSRSKETKMNDVPKGVISYCYFFEKIAEVK